VRSGSDRRQRVDLTLGEYARSKIWVPFQREHGVAMEVLEGDGRIFGVMSEKLRGSQSTGGARVPTFEMSSFLCPSSLPPCLRRVPTSNSHRGPSSLPPCLRRVPTSNSHRGLLLQFYASCRFPENRKEGNCVHNVSDSVFDQICTYHILFSFLLRNIISCSLRFSPLYPTLVHLSYLSYQLPTGHTATLPP
jgi:hypothetical protein